MVTSAFCYTSLSHSVITSCCIIPGILCSKIWVPNAVSLIVCTLRKVTTSVMIRYVPLNRTDVVHDYVKGTVILGLSSYSIIRSASST